MSLKQQQQHLIKTFLVSLFLLLVNENLGTDGLKQSVIINRHFLGDIFATSECDPSFCDGGGSNEAERLRGSSDCECQCKKNHATYREDKKACVNDLQECALAEFFSNSSGEREKIPFVFLPLSSGQTIYPNANIQLIKKIDGSSADVSSTDTDTDANRESLCVVSSTQLLFSDGWHTLETVYGQEFYHHPFRISQEQGSKTNLQWTGDDNMRQILDGKLVLLNLLCQTKSDKSNSDRDIQRPCISFRVAGSPGSSILTHMDKDMHNREDSNRLGASDYIAIGVCVGFLVIVYVIAVVIFIMFKRRRKRKERIRQQFLLPPSTLPPGLGYKSSRILGLEEAFIPELRKIEPIPGMSEANLERLQRRHQALEEERRSRFKERQTEEVMDLRQGMSQNDVLEKNQKLFDAAHRMFGNPGKNNHDGDSIEKIYVNPNFHRPEGLSVSHLVGDLPPLSPNRLINGSRIDKPAYDKSYEMSRIDMSSSKHGSYNDEDEGYPATLNVEMSKRNVVNNSSTSSREIHDPMSLDSGVITTLSRSISPMSSSNRGSSGTRMEMEEETNVDDVAHFGSDVINFDDVVNVASEGDDSEDRDSGDQNYFDSLRHSKDPRQKRSKATNGVQRTQHRPPPTSGSSLKNNPKSFNRFNDNANVAVPFNLKNNDVGDPLAKLYDTAVLKIPKVIASDSESLYSECNSSFGKSRFPDLDLYGRKRRNNYREDKLEEAPEEEDLYEVIRSEEDSDSSSSSSSGGHSNNSSICDVYVNKYMNNGMASEMSNTEADDSERDDEVLSSQQSHRSRTCDISSMGKMIVTIGGGSENKEASVSSGKLLIEVRDERSTNRDPGKPRRSKVKKWRENDTDEEAFDPDTLERGLGGGAGPKHSQIESFERLHGLQSTKSSNNNSNNMTSVSMINSPRSDISNPDYSFRLFDNGHAVESSKPKTAPVPPELPPKTRGSSLYSSSTPSLCSVTSGADSSTNDKPKVPPKVKQKSSLTAERKQYFEGLTHTTINER